MSNAPTDLRGLICDELRAVVEMYPFDQWASDLENGYVDSRHPLHPHTEDFELFLQHASDAVLLKVYKLAVQRIERI
jgi:hypothetical protein